MSFALNEIEAMAKKAARGAGYGWGLAEEAAKATRWLCAYGIDGTSVLAGLLSQVDGRTAAHRPVDLSHDRRAAEGALCPISAGASLSDTARMLSDGAITAARVLNPALLLPFAAAAARQTGNTVTVEWQGLHAVTDGNALSVEGDALTVGEAANVSVKSGGETGMSSPNATRATPENADWEVLLRFAERIYAPDTEESRMLGAGAGLTDND